MTVMDEVTLNLKLIRESISYASYTVYFGYIKYNMLFYL
jgi:hypothetical protein